MSLRVRTTLVPIRHVRRYGRLAPKLPALVIASTISLIAALTTNEAATEEADENKPSVVYRHFV